MVEVGDRSFALEEVVVSIPSTLRQRTGAISGVRIRLGSNEPLHFPYMSIEETDEADVIFDAAHLLFTSPLDLAALTSWASALRAEDRSVLLVLPHQTSALNYLVRMNVILHLDRVGVLFDRAAPSIQRNDQSRVLIEVRCVADPSDAEAFSQVALDLLRQHISGRDARVAYKILGELLDNATTHAKSPTGVFACAQVYRHELELAVADAGIGIQAHLSRNPKYRLADEVDALEYALMPGVSGTSEPRGNGLPDLVDMTCRYGGRVLLRSQAGHALVTTVNNRREFQSGTPIPGTCAAVRIGIPATPPGKMP